MIRRVALAALAFAWSACSVSAGLPRASFTASRGTAAPSAARSSSAASSSSIASPASPSSPSSANDNAAALALVVPDVMGKTADEARAIVKAAGFHRDVELNESLGCPDAPRTAGRIFCQNPAAGTRVSRNDWIQVAVPAPAMRLRPGYINYEQLRPLVGLPLPEVKRRLKQLGHTGHLQIEREGNVSATCHDDRVCSLTQEGDSAVDADIWIELAEGTAP
jgi:hypothetical protein